jgi:hypothetical protein
MEKNTRHAEKKYDYSGILASQRATLFTKEGKTKRSIVDCATNKRS